jgi:hypothetical protein
VRVEIIGNLVAGLVVTSETRDLVRRVRTKGPSGVHVKVRSVGVEGVGVCMLCSSVSRNVA